MTAIFSDGNSHSYGREGENDGEVTLDRRQVRREATDVCMIKSSCEAYIMKIMFIIMMLTQHERCKIEARRV